MVTNQEFGNRLRRARYAKGFTQYKMAFLLGVSQSSVGNWEAGHCYPGTGIIDDVCRVLDITPNWLFGHSESPYE